ncbi:MAG: gliding motility-associated C-terminal domain-containing protein [Bacteroidia bacterium]
MKKSYSLSRKKIFIGIASLSFIFCGSNINAQIFFNNGAQVYVASSTIVQINAGLQSDNIIAGPGDFDNEGIITVTSNGAFPGNIDLTNNSVMHGNGTYYLDQNWINDATFNANNSVVNMNGNAATQLITSTTNTITTFDTLELTGTGVGAARIKRQTLNANVTNALIINDRELATDNNTMRVLTPTLTAVTNTTVPGNEGFVSSLGTGSLSRVTNTAAVYFYPTGSSLGTTRYRPVKLTPVAANIDTFSVRLANNDPTLDSYNKASLDSTLCKVNPLFYHLIKRVSGTDNAAIDIFYDQTNDGSWNGIAQWNTPQVVKWNNTGVVTATTTVPLSDVLKTNWSNFSNTPYVLAAPNPAAPVINCIGPICPGTPNNLVTVTGNGTSYTWTTPGGTTIVSGQGTDSLIVNWGNTPGTITVISNSNTGCSSSPASCTVSLNPKPDAGFDTISSGTYNNLYAFNDTSKGGVTSWAWLFGDGSSSTSQNPTHNYPGAGIYPVTEVVTNAFGCKDTITYDVKVNEGIIIPNVFTPNGDGKNDEFYIPNSGMKQFSIDIFNRWGVKVFSSTASDIRWDGRSTAGVNMSDGTYYYILKAVSTSGKDYNVNGFVTLIRGK